MAQDDLASELKALETRFWTAMQDKDGEAAAALSAPTCLLTGAQGVSKIDRSSLAKMMQSGGWTLKSFRLDDFQVERVTEDVAVVGYTVREDLEVECEAVSFEAADASTWVRKGDSWVCALHTESILGDPFGRDRKARLQ